MLCGRLYVAEMVRPELGVKRVRGQEMKAHGLFKATLAGFLLTGLSSVAQGALYDRGGGLIYDDVLDVTWLQDANYAKTSGYDADGRMKWAEAMAWTSNLLYIDSVSGITLTGWRLPTARPINDQSFQFRLSNDGSTDYGFNIGAVGSAFPRSSAHELPYMYYINLENLGECAPTSAGAGGCLPSQPGWGLNEKGPFINLEPQNYWTGIDPGFIGNKLYVDMSRGAVNSNSPFLAYGAWAVRDGDVADDRQVVPLPASAWLLGSGFIGLLSLRKSKKLSRIRTVEC